MQQFHIRASIYDVAPERLHQLLKALVGELTFRSRIVGYQMFYKDSTLQMSVETMDDVNATYTLDAHLQCDASGAEAWVKAICQCLEKADILYLLGYVEEDADGDELGEELSFSHPEFEARYQAR